MNIILCASRAKDVISIGKFYNIGHKKRGVSSSSCLVVGGKRKSLRGGGYLVEG